MSSSLRLLLIALVCLVALPPASVVATPQVASLAAEPAALTVSLPLGQRSDVAVSLTNSGPSPLSLSIYEGLAAPAAGLRGSPPAGPLRVPLPAQQRAVDPRIAEELAASPDGRATFLVVLAEQADLAAAAAAPGWTARGRAVYQALAEHAERTQQAIRAELDARETPYQPLWIINGLLVEGTLADVQALAARPEVAALRADRRLAAPQPATPDQWTTTCDADATFTCWHLRDIRADRVWRELGVDGSGIVVGMIDSGVRFDHPALVGAYRGNLGDGRFNHNYNWIDRVGGLATPADAGAHGTHTTGLVAGRGGSTFQPAVGAAPGARWIAARACDAVFCGELALIQAAQWMLAPTDLSGNNPRPDLRPNIINNSWTFGYGGEDLYDGYVTAWRAAGIFPVFATGNRGFATGCRTADSPGDDSMAVAVGASGRSGLVASFSSVGPGQNGRMKPDLVAPGASIASTFSGSGLSYGVLNGTSMASPLVAATVALLWAADPTLIGNYQATYIALTSTARPVTDDGRFQGGAYAACSTATSPNNVYGYGILDTYAAVRRATVDVPWLGLVGVPPTTIAPGSSAELRLTVDAGRVPAPGSYQARILIYSGALGDPPTAIPISLTVPGDPSHVVIEGRLTSAQTGQPLLGRVQSSAGAVAEADQDGRYRLVVPPQSFMLTASARAYLPQVVPIIPTAGTTTTLDLSLVPDVPRLSLASAGLQAELDYGETADLALPFSNTGSQPLTFTITLANDPYGLWRSVDTSPSLGWIEPPPEAVRLNLADDAFSGPVSLGFEMPFYGKGYRQVFIGSNGVVAFEAPTTVGRYLPGCAPVRTPPGPAVLPLYLDLNPALGGSVSYGAVPGGLLITYDTVPLADKSMRTASFQVLLTHHGAIRLIYRALPTLGPFEAAAIGVQLNFTDGMSVSCGRAIAAVAGETLELRPQARPEFWLTLLGGSGQALPGGVAAPSVRLRWAHHHGLGFLRTSLAVRTNDPLQPAVLVPVELRVTPAPFQLYMPQAIRE